MKRSKESGFTLLELLVVVIIVGILATVAVPSFTKAMERARQTEAAAFLDTLKTSEEAYYQENQKYTGSFTDLMIDKPADASTRHYFKYSVASATATTFTGTATRKTSTDTGKSPAYSTAYTVVIKEDGTLTTTGF